MGSIGSPFSVPFTTEPAAVKKDDVAACVEPLKAA